MKYIVSCFLFFTSCVPIQSIQDTSSDKKEGITAVGAPKTDQNTNEPSNENQNNNTEASAEPTSEPTSDPISEPTSEPTSEPELPSYIGGYNVNPCYPSVQPTGYGVGQVAEDFALVDQYGETLRLSDFCGNAVLLVSATFW